MDTAPRDGRLLMFLAIDYSSGSAGVRILHAEWNADRADWTVYDSGGPLSKPPTAIGWALALAKPEKYGIGNYVRWP